MLEGMIKQFSPGSWSNLPEVEDKQIKIASGGLGYADRKTAEKFADPEMLFWLSRMDTHPDCAYVHKLAMGCSDKYGPNRWGDGFREEVLDRDCPTFEQYARAYRMHKSKEAYYGRPKIARVRKPAGVVELVTEYYGTDKVAAANGGKLADLELNLLARDGYIPVSMGSKVPGDRCVACGNWAPKRAQYCTSKKEGGTCTLFGCKNGMLKIASDGQQQYVDNPINLFYDISAVDRGADPIANGILLPLGKLAVSPEGLDDFLKVANYLPESILSEETVLTSSGRDMLKLAYVFADFEAKLAAYQPTVDDDLGLVYGCDYSEHVKGLHSSVDWIRNQTIRELARADICPSFGAYAKAAGYSESKIAAMRPIVADLYTQLCRQRLVPNVIKLASSHKNTAPNFATSKIACIHDGSSQSMVLSRTLAGNAAGATIEPVKRLSIMQPVPDIAVKYASFKLAWANDNPQIDFWRLSSLVRRELVTVGQSDK